MNGSYYTDEQRRQAVIAYEVHGNLEHVERTIGIPARTISDWTKTDWWNHLTTEVRSQVSARIGSNITRILEKTLNSLDDRIDNGDVVLTKDGEQRRIPMKGRDLAVTGAILFDKRQLLMNRATSISENRTVDGLATEMLAAFKQAQERVINGQAERVSDIATDQSDTYAQSPRLPTPQPTDTTHGKP